MTEPGFNGVENKNPYSFTQYAVVWWELLAEAQVALADSHVGDEPVGGLYFGQAYFGFYPSASPAPVPSVYGPPYFQGWLIGMILNQFPGYVITGPTSFTYAEVVFLNPCPIPIPGCPSWVQGVIVYNRRMRALSILNANSLSIIPPEAVALGVQPI